MNTTTTTRGVSEAIPNDDTGHEFAKRHGLFIYEVDFGDEGKGRYIRLSDFNRVVAALSAEPAAQGEEEFDARKYVRHMADVLEAGGDLFKVDADLLRLAAAINKAANTAPPAQEALIRMTIRALDDVDTEMRARGRATMRFSQLASGWRGMLTASPAPSEGGKGVDDKCPDCLGYGEKCLAGCSAHESNWYECETCNGTGKKQAAR